MSLGHDMAEDSRWENEQRSKLEELGAKTWRTRDGRVMKWSDMDDDHLRNTARFIERNWRKALAGAYVALAFTQGEMAEDHIQSQIDMMEDAEGEVRQYAADMAWYAENRP